MSRNDDGKGTTGTRGTLTHAIERNAVPLGVPLAVEFTFTAPHTSGDDVARLPLSVGLAIDRSGSMEGGKLQSAREAAAGVLDALHDGERFAAAAFDHELTDIAPSVRLDARTRSTIRPLLSRIEAGGTTALFDGFARAAELVALGASPSESDSWVIVLSDGMGNQGLTDPATMRVHASALADRAIRTISIGIGEDYQASQLTALAEGGSGAFHHASFPNEIVEIVLGELRSLRQVTTRDLQLRIEAHGTHRFSLLGGEVEDDARAGNTRFARVSGGRTVRVIALVWPRHPLQAATLSANAHWIDGAHGADSAALRVSTPDGPGERNIELAQRAARLWHARIVSTALEMNERGEYEKASRYVHRWERRFRRYVAGLPGMEDLLRTLPRVGERVLHQWGTVGHKEAYVMARKAMRYEDELRLDAVASFDRALDMDAER